jgi:hypothetical protein
MSHRSFFALAHSIFAVAVATMERAAAVIGAAVDSFVAALMAIVPPGPKLVLADGFSMELGARGTGLDRALQNDLRHEAGVSRRSADRHI